MKENCIEVSKSLYPRGYSIRPMHGWSMIIKSKYTHAKNGRQLKKYIQYWAKRGYDKVKMVESS